MIKIVAEDQLSYYTKCLSIISALSPSGKQLSPQEIELLSRFLSLPSKYDHFPFTALSKKIVYPQYSPRLTISVMSARISSLIQKGYLVRDEDNFVDFAPVIKKIRRTPHFDAQIQTTVFSREDSQGS